MESAAEVRLSEGMDGHLASGPKAEAIRCSEVPLASEIDVLRPELSALL